MAGGVSVAKLSNLIKQLFGTRKVLANTRLTIIIERFPATVVHSSKSGEVEKWYYLKSVIH